MNDDRIKDDELNEELSAFMDGELDPDRARFLQQRLSHDTELRARWERWQLMSSAMRRQAQPVPAGFADRVAKAIDAEVMPVVAPRPRGLRWAGGLAVAASLIVATTFAFHPTHGPVTSAPQVAAKAAPILPIKRAVVPFLAPVVHLPIPVESGVVTAFHSPLRPVFVRAQQHPDFSPFPQPYAIDPELEAYLQSQKTGATHDVFSQDASGNGAVRTVAFPQEQH